MKSLVLLFCVLKIGSGSGTARVRQLLQASYHSRAAAIEFRNATDAACDGTPLSVAYGGMADLMMCNYVTNPFSKLSYFYSGRNALEQAICLDSANAELRFLRFTVQCSIPAFLGYCGNMEDDKRVLIGYLASGDAADRDHELGGMIAAFLAQRAACTGDEKSIAARYLKLCSNRK